MIKERYELIRPLELAFNHLKLFICKDVISSDTMCILVNSLLRVLGVLNNYLCSNPPDDPETFSIFIRITVSIENLRACLILHKDMLLKERMKKDE